MTPAATARALSQSRGSRIVVQCHNSLAEISEAAWDHGIGLPTPLRQRFLGVSERSGINDLTHWYVRMSDHGEDVARANLFISTTDFSTFDTKLPSSARETIKRWFPGFMTFRMLECGFFTMIGEGLAVGNPGDLPDAIRALAGEMAQIADDSNADFLLVRDIPAHKYETYRDVLRPLGYYPLLGFPNTVVPIAWRSVDEYLAALNSKTRLKFKNTRKLKEKFDIDVHVIRDYGPMAPDLARLWDNVHRKAKDYSREVLDTRFFEQCAESLPENSEIIAFTHGGRLIAFMLNLWGEDDYLVLDWGADYEFEHFKEANLYRAATLYSLERAIALHKQRMELGITNYTPKLTLGAEIAPMIYFIKHRANIRYSKALARLLSSNISQPDASAHVALKDTSDDVVDLAALEERIKRDQNDMPSCDMFQKVDRYHRIDTMRLAGIYGLYPEFGTAQGSCISFSDGRDVVLLGTNSYLGLATDPEVVAAATSALQRYGTGCSGSPLLNGTLDIHNCLERELADFLGREAVVLCSTGYQTNLAGLSAMCGPGDLVMMDARNHRSLFDGVRLSGADFLVYRHNDLAHLRKLLAQTCGKRRFIVTDSLFSMEGTIPDLRELCALAREFDARVYVDESHALGVLGANGRGVCELQGVEQSVDLVMGTFSKSFAALGGFIAGTTEVIEFIKHNAGGHIFSASLPPSAVETVRAALRIVRREPERRSEILKKAQYMAGRLSRMGYRASYHGSQIVPITLGNYTLALAAYRRFMEHGVYVNPVGPPAVPEADAGFRTSYIATHRWEDLDRALAVFETHRADFAE